MSFLTRRLKVMRGAVRASMLLALSVGVLVPAFLWADAPAWWTERGVLNPSATADDYAAVNQGQVKHIAKQGYEEIKARLGSAGTTLDSIWTTPATSTDDYQAINLGQLKNVAKPFYDELISVGYTTQYPWNASANPADDYALANIGQVKNLFSFDLSAFSANLDSDGDGLPDQWELYYFGDLSRDGSGDWNNDGLLDRDAFSYGLNPKGGDESEVTGNFDVFHYDARGWMDGVTIAGSITASYTLDTEGNIELFQ